MPGKVKVVHDYRLRTFRKRLKKMQKGVTATVGVQGVKAEEVYDEMLAQGGWSRRGRFAEQLESDERANRWRAYDLFATAMAHLGKGMLAEARVQLEEALELDPSSIWVRHQLASMDASGQ